MSVLRSWSSFFRWVERRCSEALFAASQQRKTRRSWSVNTIRVDRFTGSTATHLLAWQGDSFPTSWLRRCAFVDSPSIYSKRLCWSSSALLDSLMFCLPHKSGICSLCNIQLSRLQLDDSICPTKKWNMHNPLWKRKNPQQIPRSTTSLFNAIFNKEFTLSKLLGLRNPLLPGWSKWDRKILKLVVVTYK